VGNRHHAAALIAIALPLGCRNPPTIHADDARVIDAAPPAPPPPRNTRIKGPLAGGFTSNKARYLALEPIFVSLDAKNIGADPLEFDVGGDYRGSYLPIRYGVYVREESGKKVCDIHDDPPMSLGGLGSVRRLGAGEAFRETFAINSVCPITTPGRYVVTIVRRFGKQFFSDAGSCDDMLASESIPKGTSPACAKFLEDAPLMATDLPLEILPYDQKALATELTPYATAAKSARDLGDQYEKTLYFQWLCRNVTCSCMTGPAFTKAADLEPFMTTTIAKLPPSPRTKCP